MSIGSLLQRRRVAISWIFATFFLALASPRPASLIAGIIPMAAGAALRSWASGHIRKQEKLATSGPYAYTRNPLYLGSFLMAFGALVMARSWWAAFAFTAVAAPLYITVMRREEQFLAGKFGDAFTSYREAVPLFFPRLTPWGGKGAEAFDPGLLRRHREWRAWAGGAAVTLLLAAKYYWLS